MKTLKFLLCSFLSCIALGLSAQQESNIWYFGNKAGISFASGSPVVLTDGQMSTIEGNATICDGAGNLLFYTDGTSVWNRNHLIMTNGTGLLGNFSSTQSAIIVKKPGSNSSYYIFTADADHNANGIRYSEVDISLSGGLGAVTTTKNVLLQTPSCEKLAAVRHCNNQDLWIISHDWNSNQFRTWLVTSTGVNTTPIVSSSGSVINGVAQSSYGQLKSNNDGTKLLSAWYGGINKLELHNFSNTTGIVSAGITLGNESAVYGCEFSQNSRLVYCASNTGNLVQYNLCAGSTAQIQASRYLVAANGPFSGSLQLGPDGKIYASRNNSTLAVINNPNSTGASCNYNNAAIPLGRNSSFGLPNYAAFYTRPDTPPFNYNVSCMSINLSAPTLLNSPCSSTNTTIIWMFGDGNSNAGNNVSWSYASPGIYQVSMIAQYSSCYSDTVSTLVPVLSCCNPNPHFNRI